MAVEFRELGIVASQDFREALRIYIDSIPVNERQNIDVIKKRVECGSEKLFVGYIEGSVAMMALLYPLKETPFVLLDYFAVKKPYRNSGVGSLFMQNIRRITGMQDKVFVLEVEDPNSGGDQPIKQSRINFYRRNGAREIKGVKYFLPPLQGNSPTEMVVLVIARVELTWLPGEVIKNLFREIYRELYGRGADDCLLVSFVGLVAERVELV